MEIKEDANLTDKEYVVNTFTDFFNLSFLNPNRKHEFVNQLKEAGWTTETIAIAEREGALKSNWNKNKYISERVESLGAVPFPITYDGTKLASRHFKPQLKSR